MLIFSNTHSFLELVLQYSNLTKVYTTASSSSNIRGTALLSKEWLKKQTQQGVVLILVNSSLETNCTDFLLELEQNSCIYGIIEEFVIGICF